MVIADERGDQPVRDAGPDEPFVFSDKHVVIARKLMPITSCSSLHRMCLRPITTCSSLKSMCCLAVRTWC